MPGIVGTADVLHCGGVPAQVEGKLDRDKLSSTKLERRTYQQARAVGTIPLVPSCMTQLLSRERRLRCNSVDGQVAQRRVGEVAPDY